MTSILDRVRSFSYGPMRESDITPAEDYTHLQYVRGYFLTDQPPLDLGSHWRSVQLGKFTLGWDGRTPFASASNENQEIVLIGRAFHLGLDTTSLSNIAEYLLLARSAGRGAYNHALYDLAGRYVVVDHSGSETYLQTDAAAMRSAYYATGGGTVSSHAHLTARLLQDERESAFGSATWFKETKAGTHPGRRTEYEAVSMLTPNTELEVATARVDRVGPVTRGATLTAEEAAAEIVPLLQRQLRALVQDEETLVSLTAGLDSRTTLALTWPVRHQVTYFSYVTHRPGKESGSEPDKKFAQQLCAEQGLRHRVVTIDSVLGQGPLHSVMRKNSKRVHAPSIAAAYRETLPLDAVHIRSNIYEIGRSFFRKANPGKTLE